MRRTISGLGALHEVVVPADWIDFNGHVNDSRHFQMTSETVDRWFEGLGADAAYRAAGHSWFTVESHVRFHAQAYANDRLRGGVLLLAHDAKRVHVWCEVWRSDDELVCSAEHLLLHVDTTTDRVAPIAAEMLARLEHVTTSQGALSRPDRVVLQPFVDQR